MRRPFGLSGGLFWVLAVLVMIGLAFIPYVGWLASVALIAAIVVWVRTPKPAAPFTVSSMDGDEDEYDED